MWPSQRLASIGLDSWQRKSRARRRDRRGIRPIVTLLEERTLLSTLNLTVTTLQDDAVTPITGQTTLRDAITTANADTTDSQEIISFAAGLNGTIDLTQALPNLANNITINGPGAASLTVQRDSTAPDFSVFTVNSSKTASISGVTISEGNGLDGGGINNSGVLTVSNDTFSNNTATNMGGGIYSIGTVEVDNSIFINNTVNGVDCWGGGGIMNMIGTLTVVNSAFSDNAILGTSSNGAESGQGGGISNYGIATVTNSTFTYNTATSTDSYGGGAIFNAGNLLNIVGSDFNHNSASTYGGGILNYGTINISYSTFSYNTVAGGGGGINNTGTMTITSSTLNNNTASSNFFGLGGGINNIGTMKVINSTLANNTSVLEGGGIWNQGTLTVTNSTIADNVSDGDCGGIANNSCETFYPTTAYDGLLTLNNTIVAGNISPYDPDIWGPTMGPAGVQTTSSNNLIGNGTGIANLSQLNSSNIIGTTANPLNPLLGPLQNYGGPTQTMALLPGSPAIDAGSNALIPAGVTTDQRGVGHPRVVNGTVDIGAFESSGFTVTVASGSGQSTGSLTAFSSPLVTTVTANNPSEPVAGGLVTFTAPPSGASATLRNVPETTSLFSRNMLSSPPLGAKQGGGQHGRLCTGNRTEDEAAL